MKRLFLIPLVVIVIALSGCKRSVSWHQKLTLIVDTPQGLITGSSVTRVAFTGKNHVFLRDLDSARLSLTGEAAMVEISPGRWLVALTRDQEKLLYNYVMDQQADGYIGLEEAIPLILDQTEPLALDLMPQSTAHRSIRIPTLVTFDDITKPESVREVDPLNLEANFGPGVSLKAVTAQITDEQLTSGRVADILGWLHWSTEQWGGYACKTHGCGDNPMRIVRSSGTYRSLAITDFVRGL